MMTLYWPSMTVALVAAHVLANVVWIGALLSETLILGRATWLSDLAEIGRRGGEHPPLSSTLES